MFIRDKSAAIGYNVKDTYLKMIEVLKLRKNKLVVLALVSAMSISALAGCSIRDFDPTVFMAQKTDEAEETKSDIEETSDSSENSTSQTEQDINLPQIAVIGNDSLEINASVMNEISKNARVSVESVSEGTSKSDKDDRTWNMVAFAKKVGEILALEETDGLVAVCDESSMEELEFFIEITAEKQKPIVFVKDEGSIYNGVMEAISHKNNVPEQKVEKTKLDISNVSELPYVSIIYDWTGMDTTALENAFDSCDGIIVAAAGNGTFSENVSEFIEESRRKPVIVRTSRDNNGNVVKGEGFDDEANQTVAGGTLTPVKARILLMTALAANKDNAEIQQLFDEYSK